MAIRRLPDGTIAADTPEEMARYEMLAASVGTWTSTLAEAFMASLHYGHRTLLSVAMEAGNGTAATDFASTYGYDPTGIGRRFVGLVRRAEAFAPHLPIPVALVGPPGRRVISIDAAFALAFPAGGRRPTLAVV